MSNPKGQTEIAAERRVESLKMRKMGASYRAIAKQLGVDHKTIQTDIKTALAELGELQDESAAELRLIDLARLDDLYLGLQNRIKNQDDKAIGHALRILERRATMLGLDAPKRQELTGATGGPLRVVSASELTDDQLAAIIAAGSTRDSDTAAS